MRAGLLKERIGIYTNIIYTNEYGEETETWELKFSTRAKLIHNRGQRTMPNGEVFYTSVKTLEVRSYVPVNEFDRIEWDNKTYRILNIDPDEAQNKKIISIELIND